MPLRLFDVARDGDRVAVVDASAGTRLTYAELDRAANAFGLALRHPGRALVLLFADNSAGFAIAYAAALLRGHAVALFDAALDPKRKSALVLLYRPAFVVDCADGPTPSVRALGAGPRVHEDLALLLSTSGSTGSAKLVRLSHGAVLSNARAIAESLCIAPGAVAPTSLPPSYSYGLSVIHSHWVAGATVVFTRHGIVTREFWQAFSACGCTSFAGVPFSYEALVKLRMDVRPPKTLMHMTQAGGRLAVPLAERFHAAMAARKGTFTVMYGQTEATARMSCLPSDAFGEKKGSAGRAISGGGFAIEEDGEVVYRGPNVMMGYASLPEDLEKGDELGRKLHTGDLGALDADGFLTLTGRKKRIAKVYGNRYNLDEVEALARSAGPVAALARDERVVVFCEGASEKTLARVRKLVAEGLGVHGDAVEARSVVALPRTPNGKTDYASLDALAGP